MANLSKFVLPVMNTTTGEVTNQEFNLAGGGTIYSATLTSGSTSVTFTGIPTSGNHLIDFYTSTGINFKAIDTATAGQVTLTFDAQSSAVTVYCEIKEV